jgi:hypothetical protein
MRLRRAGDPAKTRKPGPEPRSDFYAQLFPEWSARTLARYRLAMSFLDDQDERIEVIKLATRPSGSVNVSRMLDMAAMRAVKPDLNT